VRLVVGCWLAAACYSPHAPEHEPCTDPAHCPTGQSCIAGFCTSGSDVADAPADIATIDAAIDGSPLVDSDGDGIDDADDNCPLVANPGQENEDGDRFGDACDPCPIEANDSPSDPDGDGLADSCDPHPTVGGDTLVLFEGFHHGIPAGWTVTGGTATQMGDDAAVTAAATAHAVLAAPASVPANVTVSMAGQVASEAGTTNEVDFGVALPYDGANDGGLMCWVYAPMVGSATSRRIELMEHAARNVLASMLLAWTDGTDYSFRLARNGTAYTCQVEALQISGTSMFTSATPQIAVRVYSATARVHWLMIVQSP
jgi:hypothetical protein